MKSLAEHKQLLIDESELNRAQLAGDLTLMASGIRALGEQAKSWRSIASAAAMLLVVVTTVYRRRSLVALLKPSRWQLLLKGAGMVSTIWLALRSRRAVPSPTPTKPRA